MNPGDGIRAAARCFVKMKPCPFCGEVDPRLNVSLCGEWWFQCRGCRVTTDGYLDEHQARFAWNKRINAKDNVVRKPNPVNPLVETQEKYGV